MQPPESYDSHLVQRLAEQVGRRGRLYAEDLEDFTQSAQLKIIEDDYAVLRKFKGQSKLETYLTTVITRLLGDYRIKKWGRWRPSSWARRRGPIAELLEVLMYRDWMPMEEAIDVAMSRDDVVLSRADLQKLAKQIPPRTRRPREVGENGLGDVQRGNPADVGIRRAERDAARERNCAALRRVLERMPPEDVIMVKMRYQDGRTVADIARALHLEQPSLYPRIQRICTRLRALLEDEGISVDDIRDMLTEEL